jgi:hypothetical protein
MLRVHVLPTLVMAPQIAPAAVVPLQYVRADFPTSEVELPSSSLLISLDRINRWNVSADLL